MTYAELVEVLDDLPLLIRHQRRRTGQSIRAAAKDAGVSFSTLSRWENGKTGPAAQVARILKWLGR